MQPFNSILFSDCWASVGNVTFYHRNGKCFARRKSTCVYPGTCDQMHHLAVHRRALIAWRSIDHETQLRWKAIAKKVRPHRPPFDNAAHISGYNLFVSSYHGFAAIGMERTPAPQPFSAFPYFRLTPDSATIDDGTAILDFILEIKGTEDYSRYRLMCKIQADMPGKGKNPGMMKTCLPDLIPTQSLSTARLEVPFSLDTREIQIHMKYCLIDSTTGYRSQCNELSACATAK